MCKLIWASCFCRPTASCRLIYKRYFQEVEKRFPDGLPLLDPVEDMGIKEKGMKEVVKVGGTSTLKVL